MYQVDDIRPHALGRQRVLIGVLQLRPDKGANDLSSDRGDQLTTVRDTAVFDRGGHAVSTAFEKPASSLEAPGCDRF